MRQGYYHPEKVNALRETYTETLRAAVERNPQNYPWYPQRSIETVVEKMVSAIAEDGIHAVTLSNSPGFTAAAKKFGIKNTYKGWQEWLTTK